MRNKIDYIKRAIAVVAGVSLFTACVNKDEFFELQDRNGLDAAIWSTEGAIQLHLNRAYDVVIPDFGYEVLGTTQQHGRGAIHYASDESFLPNEDELAKAALGLGGEPLGNNSVFFVGNKYSSNKGDNKYNDIARCNNAIKYIPEGTLPRETQRKYLGQYYALRAMVYFDLIKVYGGVPLVLEPQQPDNIVASGRASARQCVTSIVRDLDSAVAMLDNVTWNDGRLTKAAAASLKAKVLLYWASPQFNPKNDSKHPYDQTRWEEALKANKEAYDICLAAGHKLSDPGTYGDIFRKEGSTNPEVIIVRSYSSTLPKRGHNIEEWSRPASEGGAAKERYRPSTRLVDAYPMKDGNIPGTGTGKYTYRPITFWVNRDPRLDATIAYNGSSWPLSGNASRKQWSYNNASGENSASKGLFTKRFTTPTITSGSVKYNSDIGGGSGMDWIEMRFAEVILNYADCANETGDLALAKNLVRQIRVRAGIEQGNAGNDYGLAAATTTDQMRDLIFNERFIEFAFENKRNADLRRTRRMHLLTGNLWTYYFEAFDDAKKKELETVNVTTGKMLRESLNLNDQSVYLQYFQPPALRTFVNRTFSIPEHHYFYTFHDDFVYTGTDIKATIGWAGGTFDPLD